MITLRQRIFILIGLGVGLLAAILLVYFFVFREKPASPPAAGGESTGTVEDGVAPPRTGAGTVAPSSQATDTPRRGGAPPTPKTTPTERYVRDRARIFVERFGSYSNQNDNTHLDDAASLATPRMREWIMNQRITESSGEYQGVITKVLASRIGTLSDNSATVFFDVQEERERSGQSSIAYRSGEVRLSKEDGEWWIEGLYWK